MTQIDPFSFFSSCGVQPMPELPKRASQTTGLAEPEVKRARQADPVPVDTKRVDTVRPANNVVPAELIKPSRMPGVKAISPRSDEVALPTSLWVEKYRPRVLSDLVGNGSVVSKFSNWLKNWSSGPEKAALLSGPAGIGKTTTARLISEQVGFQVLEFNASDTRSKTAIDELANGLCTNNVFGPQSSRVTTSSVTTAKIVIVMDEVDGMAGGDRGGTGAMIQMIKKTKVPIVCICNDRMDPKIRSLANHCVDLRFSKPSNEEVAKRAAFVCRTEQGLLASLSHPELINIAESAACDMRQVVNHLQLLSGAGRAATATIAKDETMGPFDIVKGMFTSSVARSWSWEKRNELFFTDYDLIPLLVQQNYAKCVDKIADPRVLPAITRAAQYISIGDVISKCIHVDSHWGLLPEMGVMAAVGPSFACNNVLPFPEFPLWLGKQSTMNKNSRLLKELQTLVADNTTTTSRNLKLSGYSDVLYQSIVSRLTDSSSGNANDNIKNTIAFIDQIGAPRDILFEVLSETRLPFQPDLFAQVDSKTKAALTRAYNAQNHLIKAGAATANPKAAKAGAKLSQDRASPSSSQYDENGEIDEETLEIDSDDGQNTSNLIKPKTAVSKAKSKRK